MPGTALNIGKCSIPIDGTLDEDGVKYKAMLKEKALQME
jgi:hypothetical protein